MSRIASTSRVLVLGSILFSSFEHVQAQLETLHETWRWVQFTTESGLPSNQVHDILETKNGVVWAATASGLAWYDGYVWHLVGDSFGLPEKLAKFVGEKNDTTIAVIVEGQIFEGNENGFRLIPLAIGIGRPNITSAVFYDGGLLLVSKADPYLIKGQDSIPAPFHVIPNGIAGHPTGTAVWKTQSHNIWLNSIDGLFELHEKTWRLRLGGQKQFFLIRDIKETENGVGLVAVDIPIEEIGLWERVPNGNLKRSGTERNQPVRTFDILPSGDAVAVYESGEVRICLKNVWKPLEPRPSELTGTLVLRFRPNGDLWVGTERGLYLHRSSSDRWTHHRWSFSDRRNTVIELFLSKDSSLWLGTGQGLARQKPGSRIEWIDKIDSTQLGIVTGINQDTNGNIWISSGASFSGSFRWNGQNWRHFGHQDGLKAPLIHKIRKDREGNLWFLGLGKNYTLQNEQPGAFKYSNGRFMEWGLKAGLSNARVYGFADKGNGDYWFATYGGISHWSQNNWNHYPSMRVLSLVVDSNNIVWFSNPSGLHTIDSRDSIEPSQAQVEYEIFDLQVDKKGALWVATAGALYCHWNGAWTTYDARSGLPTLQLRGILPTEDRVYIGSQGGGLTILELQEAKRPPLISTSDPVVQDSDVLLRWRAFAYWGSSPPSEIETQFRIDQAEWSAWNRSQEILLRDISSGEHTFHLRAKTPFGSFDISSASMSFVVPPSTFRRPEVAIPVSGLLAATTYLTISAFTRKRRHIRELREQRDRIASDLHDEVGSNLGSIALVSQRLKKNTELPQLYQSELTTISRTALTTADTIREIVWYINPEHDSVENLIVKMREFANILFKEFDYSFITESIDGEMQMDLNVRRNMFLMFKETVHNIIRHARATQVSIHIMQHETSLHFQILDNGRGFDVESHFNGIGLVNLRKRVTAIHGRLQIDSSRKSGTVVRFSAHI